MSLPVDEETLIDTITNTMAWHYEAGGSLRRVTAVGGVDLQVHFIKSSTNIRLRMKEGREFDASWILNTFVPFDNPIGPGRKQNSHIFKHWTATEPGREPGKRDLIFIQFDSFQKSLRFVAYYSMAANQEPDKIRAHFPPPPTVHTPALVVQQEALALFLAPLVRPPLQHGHHQEDEEEEDKEDVIDAHDDDDDTSVDLLAATDDDEDSTLGGSLTDNDVRHEDADDDDDDDDESNGHLGFVDCSQQHVF
jgi:hypothetical protein